VEAEWHTTDPLLTDSGTTALTLALLAGGGRGVALPAYGCYDLVTAALGAGMPVRWYDLDPATLGPDPASLARAVEAGVGAVVIAHYYGVPVEMGPVRELARRHGALVIEDAAQGIGGTLEGRPLGAHGDLGVLSFGRGKGLTGGGGGALLVNTPAGKAARAALDRPLEPPGGGARPFFTTAAQWMLARPWAYALPSAIPSLKLGETVFRPPEPLGAMNPVSLSILAATLDRVIPEAEVRRKNAAWLVQWLGPGLRVPGGAAGQPGYLRLPVLLGRRMPAEKERSGRALGIMPGYPRVLNALPGATSSAEEFAGAAALVERLVTVPVHSRVSEQDRAKILDWISGQETNS
jgi:dTDP-4-amino-4,6-dideoxygalactose transaminase